MIKNILRNPIGTIIIHVAIFFSFYCVLSFLGFINSYPTNGSLLQWDAWWYKSIIDNGYSFKVGQQSNVAFFPLFPWLWKISSLSVLGISVVNFLLFYVGVVFIQKTYNLESKILLLLLSTPSLFFCYVPYSEAIFFFAGSLMIYGLKKNNWIAILGVFIACLSRSASLMFIPVILFAKFYNYVPKKDNKKLIQDSVLLLLSAVISTLLAQYIQYLESGKFFTLFEAQKEWNRFLSLPKLYLTTWDGARLIWLDGLALFVGLISLYFCFVLLVKKFYNKHKTISSHTLFSFGYLALIAIVTVMYSSEDAKGGTSIYSLNRFIFASPFFFVFIISILKRNKVKTKGILCFMLISLLTWLLFNMAGYMEGLQKFSLPFFKTKIYFGIVFCYSGLYLLITNKKYKDQLWSGLYVINIILQIYLFNGFLNGTWIG
ncbi:MAG: hypothetical protein ACJAUV_001781 [Flavobacteriales bacterium]|jgi:hypothetical protein